VAGQVEVFRGKVESQAGKLPAQETAQRTCYPGLDGGIARRGDEQARGLGRVPQMGGHAVQLAVERRLVVHVVLVNPCEGL